MYYIFESTFKALKREKDTARVENASDNFFPDMFCREPLKLSMPLLRFSVPSGVKLLDNHVTGSTFELYSKRLVGLIRNNGIRFETFPAEIISRNSGEVISDEYSIFHLLEPFDAIDLKKSIISKRRITKLVMSEQLYQSQKLMVRDTFKRYLVFIHEDLKKIFDENNITGCNYVNPESYRIG